MQREVLLKIEQDILDPVTLALVVDERGAYRSADLHLKREGPGFTHAVYFTLHPEHCDAMIEALQKAKAMLSQGITGK